ncbi:MAG: shikimate dehydrogenase, partial [Pseudomonadota bacterium]|nr:shikimate dehydrogenase [Pseudomonadota bacterium]
MTLPSIPLAGVIGNPIAHSKSPVLHGHWLKTYDIAGHYVPLEVEADALGDVLKAMPKMGFVGCNVTIPHKERVMQFVDQITDRATLIGAVNTLIFLNDGSILGDNTDGYGFIENLRQGAPEWDASAGPAVVLGAGGAARAVVASLLDAGAP